MADIGFLNSYKLKGREMVRKSLGDERTLVEKTDCIQIKMTEMSKLFVDLAALVKELHDVAGDSMLAENLLRVRAGISPADTRSFNNVAELLTENASLKDKAISPETLRALSAMPRETRTPAVSAVAAGQLSDTQKLHEIGSFAEHLRDRGERSASLERKAYLEGLAQALVPQAVMGFEELAGELVEAIRGILYIYEAQNSIEGFDYYSEDDYADAHRDIRTLASLVLIDFETLFGEVESFLDPPENDTQANMLDKACRALLRFVDGDFGHEGGFALDKKNNAVFCYDLFDAVRYLCVWPATERRGRHLQKLRVLEFGAGAGGMAIGLMAAGFQHVALLEKMNTRFDTLKSNWPSWKVGTQCISEVSDVELERHRGIDLLAGSIPGLVFSRKSTLDKRGTANDHFPDAVRAVRITKPRSFMFTIVETATFAQHAAYLAEVCSDLTRLGYNVEQVRLAKRDFGLPQEGDELLLVGIRSNEPGTFIIPALVNPLRRSIAEVIGPTLIKYESSGPLSSNEDSYSPQGTYNAWARDWYRWCSDEELLLVIPVSPPGDTTREKMSEAGINGVSYADAPPLVDEVKDNHFQPRLTVSAIARLQGFPENWSFSAELSGCVDMIAEAIPPILARAVGLSIYQALTGVPIDLDVAIRDPLIDETRIGKAPPKRVSLSDAWYKTHALKGMRFMKREDELMRSSNPDEIAGALEEYMKELVPMKRGKGAAFSKKERGAVMAAAERTRLHIEQDCFPIEDGAQTALEDNDR